jgi:tetrahydromethanopterin S-methyltransferase subunit E
MLLMILRAKYQLNIFFFSQITLAFLMSVLIKKPFLTGLSVFLLTIFWGSLGFTAMYRHLPAILEWILGLLSPFAFTAGMAQVRVKTTTVSFQNI